MAGGGPRPGRSGQCPVAAYSAPSKGLSVTAGVGIHAAEGTIVDSTADQPASPANTMSVTVDLNQCAGGALPTDRPTQINLAATTSSLPTDSTRQTFWVQGTG